MLKTFFVVLGKELRDALRDRRTLARLLIPAVFMGPLMLMVISNLVSSLEAQAEQREVMAVGMDSAPTLRNYLERQTYTIKAAPADYEDALRKSRLNQPVLVVGKDFEKELADGDQPRLVIVSDSANQRAQVGVRTLTKLVQGFSQERGALALMLRGVPTGLLQPVDVDERDLASTQARASQITGMIPMFIIMAVLYGALTAALDTTAGERERGSLEPLLMNPVQHLALVFGKWAAVALLGMAVAVLANLGYVPAQNLIHNESLQAMFRFGADEALRFLALQLPLAAGLSALLMAVAIRSKTYKEAQAGSALVITGISLAPMVSIMNPGAEPFWYYLVPGLGQYTLMMQVLKGQALQALPVLTTVAGGVLLTVLGLAYVARSMKSAVAR